MPHFSRHFAKLPCFVPSMPPSMSSRASSKKWTFLIHPAREDGNSGLDHCKRLFSRLQDWVERNGVAYTFAWGVVCAGGGLDGWHAEGFVSFRLPQRLKLLSEAGSFVRWDPCPRGFGPPRGVYVPGVYKSLWQLGDVPPVPVPPVEFAPSYSFSSFSSSFTFFAGLKTPALGQLSLTEECLSVDVSVCAIREDQKGNPVFLPWGVVVDGCDGVRQIVEDDSPPIGDLDLSSCSPPVATSASSAEQSSSSSASSSSSSSSSAAGVSRAVPAAIQGVPHPDNPFLIDFSSCPSLPSPRAGPVVFLSDEALPPQAHIHRLEGRALDYRREDVMHALADVIQSSVVRTGHSLSILYCSSPFDYSAFLQYNGENVLFLSDFVGDIPLALLLSFLAGNKTAVPCGSGCVDVQFEHVFFLSRHPLETYYASFHSILRDEWFRRISFMYKGVRNPFVHAFMPLSSSSPSFEVDV